MATAVGAGFDLSKLLSEFSRLDKELEKFMQKGKTFEKNWQDIFNNMGQGGLKNFASQLASVRKSVVDFGKQKVGVQWDSKSLQKYIDDVNKLILVIKAVQKETKKNNIKGVSIVGLKKELKEAQELLVLVKRTEKSIKETSTNRQQTYKGSLRYSSNAKTVEQDIQAIKNLEAARAKLKRTDADYEKKLSTLNNRIREHKKNLDNAKKGAQELQDNHKNLINTGEQLKRALLGVFSVSAIKGYVNKLVEVRGEFELQHKSLQVLIQDVDKANKLWDKTVALAINSPFRVKDLVTYTKQLAAYRVETDKLYDKTKMLADVSAGLGVDMNRLILAYGQVKAANFLRGTELRQFTEAGIPMLEKLAEYFSEMENKAVSAADVFERISKRGVSFGDVDAVLERMTSEGGEFYKMQEKQAETLKGMINNLRDSIDLMLSDIGENQEGKLKGVISATKDIVDNWRAVAVAIKQVGLAIAFVGLKQFALGWRAVTLATFEGTAAMSGASKIAATLRLSLQKLFATMKAHPLMFLAGAAISAGHAMWNYSKSLKEVNKKYDELSAAELRRADALNKVKKQVDNNNSVIKDSNKSQDEHNEAIKRNEKILKDLKRDYPDIYSSIILQKDGTVELTNAIEEQNRKLQANIALQQQAKGGFFQESQSENYKDAVEDQSELQSALYKTRAVAMDMGAKLKYAVSQGQLSEEDASSIEEWIGKLKKATTAKEIFDARWNTPFMTSKVARTLNVDVLNKALVNLSNAYNDYNDSLDDLGDTLDNQMDTFKVELSEINTELGRGTWLQQQLNNLGILDKEIQLWAKDYIEKKVQLTITFPKPDDENVTLKSWQETYNRLFGDNDETIVIDETHAGFKKITNEATKQSEVIDRLQAEWKSYDETIKKIEKIGIEKATGKGGAYEGIDYKQQIQAQKEVEKQLDFFGAEYEKNKKDRENEALQRLKKQISLIREAAKAYDDMRKLHDEAYASERIVSDYEDAFREAGLGGIDKYSFGTREDERNNLNKLEDSAKRVKGGMLELSKAIAQVSVNIDDANQELSDKKLFDAISDIFSNYEISLEMDKLNIPSDLAEQLFGFESIDLNEIRGKVLEKFGLGSMVGTSNQGIYDSAQFKAMSKERQDELRKSLEKEEELQDKSLKERMNRFVKFLKDSMNEITVVQKENANDISFASKLFDERKIDASTYTQVIKRLVHETNSEISKIKLEKFKESSTYIAAMGDLSSYSKKELQSMLNTLKDVVAQNAKFMSADEIKAYYDSIENINEDFEKLKMPWSNNNYNDIARILELEKRRTEEKAKQAELERQRMLFEAQLKQLEKTLQTQQINGASQTDISTTMRLISAMTLALQGVNGEINATSANISSMGSEMEGLTNGANGAITIVDKIIKEVYNSIEATKKMFDDIKALADSYGADTENESWSKWSSAMETVGNVNSEVMQGWENLKSGNIMGAIANTIGSITKLIQGINEFKDIDNEKEIERQQKEVERLEKAYGKLEKAMDEAYNVDQMNANKMSMEQNINAQIDALEAAKAAEEDKKNADKSVVDDYTDQINELEEKKAELEREMVETMGGTYDYASVAEEWADAWIQAFEETGDGLEGLKDTFEDTMKNLFKKQVVYKGLSDIVSDLQTVINTAINDGTLDETDMNNILAEANEAYGEADSFMSAMVDLFKKFGWDLFSSEGELSGLQAGIQGITETQADILAAYWNAVRFDVSAIRQRFEEYLATQGISEDANPMLTVLNSQLEQLKAIRGVLDDAITGGDSTVGAFRVRVVEMK